MFFKDVLTDPRDYDPNNFIYLVHGIMMPYYYTDASQEMRGKMIDTVNRIKDPKQYYRASLIGHLSAEFAKQKIGWYGREVHQLVTFGNIGLILRPASDGLVEIAWNCDLGSPNDQKELAEFVQKYKERIKNPLILLTQSILHNELILRGDKNTKIVGVFFIDDSKTTEYDDKVLRELVKEIKQKEQTEVPVIKLPAPENIDYDKIKDPENREKMKKLYMLKTQAELKQIFAEFYDPPTNNIGRSLLI